MKVDVDVLVVGAGPAGSAASMGLLTRGLRVAMVDRAEFPRPKACGDGLTPRALAALQRLHAWVDLEPHAVVVDALRTFDLRTGDARIGPLPSRVRGCPDVGAVVARDVLDDVLRLRAMRLGAEFHGGVRIDDIEADHLGRCVVVGRGGVWRRSAAAVIVADGAGGSLGGEQGLRPKPAVEGVAVRQYWRVASVPRAFTICVPIESGERSYAGYGWIFPAGEGLANVGVGLYGVRRGREVRSIYEDFVQRLREIEPVWSTAIPCGAMRGGLLHSGRCPSALASGALLLAGDAAAVTNPFTGEGIAQALDCGEMAAQSVIDALEGRERLDRSYDARLRATFPETTRVADDLPWLVSRGARFVPEFWGAISPPRGVVGRAARRLALEEQGVGRALSTSDLVGRTWAGVVTAVARSYPLVGRLVESVRSEATVEVDAALEAFWKKQSWLDADETPSELGDVAELLLLAVLISILADGVQDQAMPEGADRRDEVPWAVNAVALGAADILLAQFFLVAARLPSRDATACAATLSRAFRTLCGTVLSGPGDEGRLTVAIETIVNDFAATAVRRTAQAA